MAWNFSRKRFLQGSALAATAISSITILEGCTHSADNNQAAEPLSGDQTSATSVTDTYESVEVPFAQTKSYTLGLGNVLLPAEGTWIPVLSTGADATPLNVGSALNIETGKLHTVIDKPRGSANTVIYDVRCSDEVYAWVELDVVTHTWQLYAQAFSNGTGSGDVKTLWEGTSALDPAQVAVTGNLVVWIVQPTLASKSTDSSYAYAWRLGEDSAQAAVESPGRFATRPVVSGSTVILTPRVRESEGTYYGVTAYSSSDTLATKVDQLVLPKGVKPFRATRIGERFMISIEASYSTSTLMSQMGTYIGTNTGQNMAFISREPSELGAGKNSVFLVKSRASYFVLDVEKQQVSVLASSDRCVDFGEYPAREGECSSFVTYATVKHPETGYPESVIVRVFSLGN